MAPYDWIITILAIIVLEFFWYVFTPIINVLVSTWICYGNHCALITPLKDAAFAVIGFMTFIILIAPLLYLNTRTQKQY